jgi:uncharacterized membrane protein (UPF0127 family)
MTAKKVILIVVTLQGIWKYIYLVIWFAFMVSVILLFVPQDNGYSLAVNGRTYQISDIATTQDEQAQGFQGQPVLRDTPLMLFVLPASESPPVWMINMTAPIDVVWMDITGDMGEVVDDVQGAPPCTGPGSCIEYVPDSPADYILEAGPGFIAGNNITIGTTIELERR